MTTKLSGETSEGSWTCESTGSGYQVTLRSGPVCMHFDGADREDLLAEAGRCGNERVRGSMVRLAKTMAAAVGVE